MYLFYSLLKIKRLKNGIYIILMCWFIDVFMVYILYKIFISSNDSVAFENKIPPH